MIAGGIGITPFLSLLGYEAHRPHDRTTYLYYCVKNANRAVFCDEIHRYAQINKRIISRIHCTATSGFLSISDLQRLPGGFKNKNFFLCGPPLMMDSFTKQLQELGVKSRNIITEHFDLV